MANLAQQIKALSPGQSFTTKASRNGIYVAAKRAGITVSTSERNGQIVVTRAGEKPKELTLLDCVKRLNVTDRLALFEHFELCCGMDRGQCICPDDVISQTMFVGKLETHPEKYVPGTTQTMAAEAEPVDEWIFTKDNPYYPDDGNVYRLQYLATNPKKRRSVQVDEYDHEKIIH